MDRWFQDSEIREVGGDERENGDGLFIRGWKAKIIEPLFPFILWLTPFFMLLQSNKCLTSTVGPKDMMKYWVLSFAFLLVAVSVAFAQDDYGFLYGYLEGPYDLVGKWADSQHTYAGKVRLIRENDHLKIVRRIDGMEIEGVGRVETVTPDKIRVLRTGFTQDGQEYEGIYIIDADLDNYARLSGYLYLRAGGTKQPGLEALFIDHDALGAVEKETIPNQPLQEDR